MKFTSNKIGRTLIYTFLITLFALAMKPVMAESPPDFPAAPENLAYEITGFDSAKFTWTAPNDSVYGTPDLYRLYLDGEFIREGNFTAYSIGGFFSIDQEYLFAVKAVYSRYGVESDLRAVRFSTVGHTLTNLRAEVYSKTAIELIWDRERLASSNLVYEVYRDGQKVFTTTGNSFYDDSLTAGTRYVYDVVISKSGNSSSPTRIEAETLGGVVTGGGVSCDSGIVVDRGVIVWPNDGWYQVQSAENYQTFCEGGISCAVPKGTYNVINLTNGKRCERIHVSTGGTTIDARPAAPINTNISVYSVTAAEIFWSHSESDIVLTEVYRDNELFATTNGTSFYDDTRARYQRYQYSLIAIDAAMQRSDRIDIAQ